MGENDPCHLLDDYVGNCDYSEALFYRTEEDLEANFLGNPEEIDWDFDRYVDSSIHPSVENPRFQQGPFVPTATDHQAYHMFQYSTMPDEGIAYNPNEIDGYLFGTTETTSTVPMDIDLDFILDSVEPQMMLEKPVSQPIHQQSYPVVQSSEKLVAEKDWSVRDEHTGKVRAPLLHEYLRMLLDDPAYTHVASYIDRRQGIFKFHDKDMAAKLWQEAKQRNCESGVFYQ